MADPLISSFFLSRKRRSLTALLPAFLPPVLAYLTVVQFIRFTAEVYFQLQAPEPSGVSRLFFLLSLYLGLTLPFHRSRVVGPFWTGLKRWGFPVRGFRVPPLLLGLFSPLPLGALGLTLGSLLALPSGEGLFWVAGGLGVYLLLSWETERRDASVVESFWFELGSLVLNFFLFGLMESRPLGLGEGLALLGAAGLLAWGGWRLNALLHTRKRTSRPFALALSRKIIPLRFWLGTYGILALGGGLQVWKSLPVEVLIGMSFAPVALGVYLLAGADWVIQGFPGFNFSFGRIFVLMRGAWGWHLRLSLIFLVFLWGGTLL